MFLAHFMGEILLLHLIMHAFPFANTEVPSNFRLWFIIDISSNCNCSLVAASISRDPLVRGMSTVEDLAPRSGYLREGKTR